MQKISGYPIFLFLFVFLLFQSVPASLLATELSGRVLTEAGPLTNAKVFAYNLYTGLESGKAPVATAITDLKGVYKMDLSPGSYYFIARGEIGGRPFFAYHGANPIKVGDQKFWLGLLANQENPVAEYADGVTGIEGNILYKQKPVDGAYISIYSPESKNFKKLGVKTESVGSDGKFKLAALPGRYVVTAKKIVGSMSNRPVQKGDLYCYNSNNPVEVKEGKITRIELSCFPITERDSFTTTATVKEDDIKTFAEHRASSGAGIRGRVTDISGKPIANMTVLAYPMAAPVTQMYFMTHGTEFSTITDDSGNFFIPIDEDGDYGVLTRDVLGDGPHRGETFGFYQGNSRYSVAFKKGMMIENIAIIADKVMQTAKESDNEKKATAQAAIIGTRVGTPVLLTDSVIASDTVWQGEIHISGVISVKRGATLTISPGTVVKFKRIDRDNNKVGDGEIMVEGRLIAKGTSDKKIVFTSAEEKPKVNDWSYLQFISSDSGNIIENCQFEYAYAGVMIHYANVRISDTLFRNNRRGLHYTSTDMRVDHCTFIDNIVGIYFVRMEGDTWITNNDISRNDIGVQFVKQHINLVDFNRLDQGKEYPHYDGNNIYDNRKYNVSLGEDQERNFSVAGNWWGTTDKETIAEAIYDQSKDKSLGRIFFEPFLKAPVQHTGVRDAVPEVKAKR
ncbi:MAG TPA: right-handed parallel beta-helix repeat-containing protein [Desulfuromonadaceae bacterium]|jgi:hypothetical protein